MTTATRTAASRTGRGILLSTVTGGIVASVANIVIGIAARAAGADPTQNGMLVGNEVFLSIAGVLLGSLGWAVVRRFATRPSRVLAVLVPVVLVLTLIPDFGLGISTATSAMWTAVVGLIVMHIVTVLIAIPVYRRFLPLPR